jgi:ubiquinone biosynthesis protein
LIGLAQERVSFRTLKLRRREIEERLAQFGLKAGPHRVVRKRVSSEENQIGRLRAALEGLGPVFCSFGLYMSTRVDLLATPDCRQLASLAEHTEQSSPVVVWEHIKRELGCRPDEVYSDFTEKPFVSGLLIQQHRAWLRDGSAVTVKLIHPEMEELIHYDAQLLHLLHGAFMSADCTSSQIESATDDFLLALQQHTEFMVHANAVATLSNNMETFGMLRVPFVYRQLTTSRMLTIERLPGQTLEQVLEEEPNENVLNDDERYVLAQRLWVVWLRQALLGSMFPAEPTPSNVTILPSSQIAFTGGILVSLPDAAKVNLWNYLIAALMDDPDRACSSLLKEMEVQSSPLSEAKLRQKFRQLVPFRDNDWAYGPDNNDLAESLFLQWKLTTRGGYRPRVHVPSFYRGLFMIANISRRLASKGDPLHQALQTVRLVAEAEKVRDLLTVSHVTEQMDAYLALMMRLPQQLDQALTMSANGDMRPRFQLPETPETRRKKNSLATAVALWLTFGATLLLARQLETNLALLLSGRISTVVFIFFGALLLLSDRRRC